MAVIILHSQYEEASRNLITSLGVPIPAGDDVMVDVGGVGVRIISDHSKCVAMQQSFRAYPVLLSIMGPDTYVLDTPETWQECQDFIDNPTGSCCSKLTRLEFLDRFTDAELVTLKGLEATNPAVALFWEKYRAAEFVDTTDPRTIAGLNALESLGHLAAGRANEILAAGG